MAIETGLRQMWREQVVGRYLRGEVTREHAVKAVGAEWVDLAERQHRALREDVRWANDPGRSS